MRIAPAAPGQARAIGRGLAVFALLAGVVAPLLEAESRNAVWVNVLAILAYVGMERAAAGLWPGRAVSLLRVTLFIAAASPVFLVVAYLLQGDVLYSNMGGRFSHSDGAWMVAGAGVVLHLAALVGALLAGRDTGESRAGLGALREAYSSWFLLMASGLVWLHLLLRLVLLFTPADLPLPVAYAARLYLSLFLAIFIFLGMAVRAGLRSAQFTLAATLGVSGIVLLSGGRADALYPLIFLAAGYVLGRPVPRATMIRWVLVALPTFLLAMYVGGRVRDDERGRTGEAVLERAADLSSTMAGGEERTSAIEASVRRLVSDSTHSVITRIPTELPFERDGVVNLPGELVERILPRFNLTGISESETPRNWMLNDLGFLVAWSTSVELSLVADAWYRGGLVGLVVVGLILGLTFQVLENWVYGSMRRRPQNSAILLFVVPWLLPIQARDIVAALRSIIFATIAALAVVWAARILEQRKRAGGRGGKVTPAAAGAAS